MGRTKKFIGLLIILSILAFFLIFYNLLFREKSIFEEIKLPTPLYKPQ